MRRVIGILIGVLAAFGPAADSAAQAPDIKALQAKYVRPREIPFPADNPFNQRQVDLGRMLFFDKRIGFNGEIACASCHLPGLGWGDGVANSPAPLGHVMPRHTSGLANLAWDTLFNWDGRADTLEKQMLTAMSGPAMNTPERELVGKVKGIPGYAPLFARAFPGPRDAITAQTIAQAVAQYERTIVSGKAPFDLWVEGDDNALGDEAKAGFVLFNGKAMCAECHSTWRFTDGKFHDIGLPGDDIGRGRLFPGDIKAQYAFKTPSLRDVVLSAPFFHDGSAATLMDVINVYDKGGIKRPSLSDKIRPLGLTFAERRQLIAFMSSLTGASVYEKVPELP